MQMFLVQTEYSGCIDLTIINKNKSDVESKKKKKRKRKAGRSYDEWVPLSNICNKVGVPLLKRVEALIW